MMTELTAEPSPWRLGRRYMLRVAALPVESVAGLRSPQSVAWADSVIDERDRLAAAGLRLSEALHEYIGQNPDVPGRGSLLAARRQLFKNRLPRAAALEGLTGRLGAEPVGELGADLADWLRERAALEGLIVGGPNVLAAEAVRSRAVLRQLAAEPRLRNGLLLASPSLDTYLDAYRTSDRPTLTKRERRIERTLLEYLFRIAYKTSPFSTFTGLVLGRFHDIHGSDEVQDSDDIAGSDGSDDGGSAGLRLGRIGEGWHSSPRLNVAVLGRIADLIVANDELCADLPVRLTPGWKSELDRVRYIRKSVNYGDDEATVGFDLIQTEVYFLSRSDSLERTLRLLEREPDLLFRDFVARLQAAEKASTQDCERWARALRGLGLLEVADLRLDIHDVDPVRGLAIALRRRDLPWARELSTRLDALAARIDEYAYAEIPERRRILGWLRQELTAVQVDLGAASVSLPQTLLYEDVRLDAAPGEISVSAWGDQIGTALEAIGAVLPAFDFLKPQQMLLKSYFLVRHGRGGRCDDLLRFVHDFQEDIYDQYMETTERQQQRFDEDGRFLGLNNWMNLPGITALEQGRQRFADGMREAWAGLSPGAEELRLDSAMMAAVAKELAPAAAPFTSVGHFVQLARGREGMLAVLNQSFGSLAFPFSRFTHCFGDLAELVRADHRALQPEGAVFAELVGGVLTTNLNLHGRMTDYQLVCPGETGSVPADEQLALDDLYLAHDEATDRVALRSHRLGREVIPVYLGYLMPIALPAMSRILMLFSLSSMATLRPWGGVPAAEPVDGVTARPRIRFQDVVLSRRSWAVEVGALPTRNPEDSDADWFLAWRTWQRGHRLPPQVFARFSTAPGGSRPAWRESKPHYVDFASFPSLVVLDHLARTCGGEVRFEEMLPAEDQLSVTSDRGSHVAEMTVEMTRYERGAQ